MSLGKQTRTQPSFSFCLCFLSKDRTAGVRVKPDLSCSAVWSHDLVRRAATRDGLIPKFPNDDDDGSWISCAIKKERSRFCFTFEQILKVCSIQCSSRVLHMKAQAYIQNRDLYSLYIENKTTNKNNHLFL